MRNKQLFMHLVDFCLLTGGHPLAAVVTLILTILDLLFLFFESSAKEMMGGFFHQTLAVNAALSFLSCSLSPASFVSLRVYVMNSPIFPVVLMSFMCFVYFVSFFKIFYFFKYKFILFIY